MSLIRTSVAGSDVKIFHLPPPSSKFIRKFVDFTRTDSIFGLDVETNAPEDAESALFAPDGAMRLIQFGSYDTAWVIDPTDFTWRSILRHLLFDESKRFVTHTNYDPLWVRRAFDIELGPRVIDTFVMASLLFPGPKTDKDLKHLSAVFIDPALQGAADELSARFKELYPHVKGINKLRAYGFSHIPIDDEIFGTYAGLDAIYVRRLLDILAGKLKEKRMGKLGRTEQRVARMAADMRWRGMKLDIERTQEVLSVIETEYMAADKRLSELWGFTPRSPRRGDWLEAHGVVFEKRTPTGRPKLDKETMPDLLLRYRHDPEIAPILKDMVALSSNQNILNNLRGALRSVDANGMVHPYVKTLAAHTGRMSATDPPVQTYKKTDKRLRGCFVARDGYVLIGADYDSQEIRIAAAFSSDPMLTKIVLEGHNQHVLTAQSIFPSFKGKEESPREYAAAKVLDFAQQYGAMPKKIALQLGISVSEATAMWKGWRKTYAGLVAWSDHVAKFDTVINPFGRNIPADPWRRYANGNYAIQSTGRDILGNAMCNLEDRGYAGTIWLPIHDELVLEVPEDEAEKMLPILEECMFYELGDIPITASAEIIGHRWGGGE